MTALYRWDGDITRMEDTRLPENNFLFRAQHCTRSHGGQRSAEDEHASLRFAAQRVREPYGRQVILAVLIQEAGT